MAPTFSSTASAGSRPVTAPAANQSGDAMPGDSFKGLEISVPYARWRGYGSEHGYHRGKLTAFSIDEDDAPEGYFTCVFPTRERADAITLTWEQVLGDKKHGSVRKACVLHGEPQGIDLPTARQRLRDWKAQQAAEAESDDEADDAEEEGEGDDEEGEDEAGCGSVEELGAAGEGDDNDGIRSTKKKAKKQRHARKARAADLAWQEVDRVAGPTNPVQLPSFRWAGLKQRPRQTRASADANALGWFDLCWPEAVKALRYEETMRYADDQEEDWEKTGGPPTRPEV